jgi:hypothetical protein
MTVPYLITTVSPSERVGDIDGPDTSATPSRLSGFRNFT